MDDCDCNCAGPSDGCDCGDFCLGAAVGGCCSGPSGNNNDGCCSFLIFLIVVCIIGGIIYGCVNKESVQDKKTPSYKIVEINKKRTLWSSGAETTVENIETRERKVVKGDLGKEGDIITLSK